MRPYLDTSAFAKWYVNETGSDDFAAFMADQEGGVISRLGLVELRCALARRRRHGSLSADMEAESYRLFLEDIVSGIYDVIPLHDEQADLALSLLDRLGQDHALRTLDSLHLATALRAEVELLATADTVMADAAEALGLTVRRF